MSGKDIYEENKRLRSEIQHLHERLANERERKLDESEWMTKAFLSFLGGDAALVVVEGSDPGTKIISFQVPASLVRTKPSLETASTDEPE